MIVKGRLQRPPVVRLWGDSIRTAATELGVVIDDRISFAKHAQYIGKKATISFGKLRTVRAVGVCVLICTWCALLKTQKPALTLLTKAYHTTSTVALTILASVLPADYEVTIAGRVDIERDNLARVEIGALGRVSRMKWSMHGSRDRMRRRMKGSHIATYRTCRFGLTLVGSSRTMKLPICSRGMGDTEGDYMEWD
ncbi:hypothetical protein EVAR_34109_1 [Eumeta japonica]|uniref:Uncharacterized protein n=1 Tax=Eumeta variegata TaxID=151549 RepID=A0A4C1WJX5_EUMVA|nr:hypothetical protein EVAR_34109_1 [Eumeta japonica]